MKILVVNAVGWNLGYLGCYGNEWIATPNLDRLAAEGVAFDRHYVHTPDIREPAGDWLEQARLALDRLDRSDGAVCVDGPSLAPPWPLPDDLAAVYAEDDEIEPWLDPPIGEMADDQCVLRVQDTYAAMATWLDAQLGRLLDDIAARPWADELLFAFASSAGLPLGEHDRFGWDRPWLYEETVHVPLIVRCPHRRFAGARISAITQPDDFAAALSAWADASPDDLGAGGLAGLISGDVAAIRPHAVSTWTFGGRSERALRTDAWALLLPGDADPADPPRSRQLYAKPDDRWEVNDVSDREVETADELERQLRESSPRE